MPEILSRLISMKRQNTSYDNNRIQGYILLAAVVVLGFLIRYPLINYNLPVSAHVDERPALTILHRFNTISFNPEWFIYPTLYYYVVFFLIKPLANFNNVSDILFYGRLVNVLFSCLLAATAFALSQQFFRSRLTSVIASGLVAASPIIIINGSYIITDILLTVFSLCSLLLFQKFFETKNNTFWLLGSVLMGFALSTKYTAVPIVATYMICQFIRTSASDENTFNMSFPQNILDNQFSTSLIASIALIVALLSLTLFALFPFGTIFSILRTSGDINSVIDAADIAFLTSIRNKFLYLGIVALLAAFVLYRFRNLSVKLSTPRPYFSVLISILVFFICSPFTLVSWNIFLYDFGTQMKVSSIDVEGPQWIRYFERYFYRESIIVFAFFILGLIYAYKLKKKTGLLYVYLISYYILIGSANRGFDRYLTPVLPVLFVISAWGISYTGTLLGRRSHILQYLFIAAVALTIGFELAPKVSLALSKVHDKDEMYGSYMFINRALPDKIYYAGYAPFAELMIQGFNVQEVSQKWLNQDGDKLLKTINANDVVVMDRLMNEATNATFHQRFTLIWSTEKGYGQYIYNYKSRQ